MASAKFDWSSVGGRAVAQPKATNQSTGFDWASVGGRPYSQQAAEGENTKGQGKISLEELKKQHPIMYKLAEKLQGSPELKKAANVAGHIKNIVEGTGLPSAAKGFFETGTNIGRGLTNLIPGVNIPKQQYNDLNVNPYVGETGEILGSFGMGGPVLKGYQGLKSGISKLPYAKKIPELVRSIIAGSATGSAISPEHRGLGAGIGAAAEIVPAAIRGVKSYISSINTTAKERDLFKAIAEHEAQKSSEASLKAKSKHNFGQTSPEGLTLSAQDKQRQLEEAKKFQEHFLSEEKQLPGQQTIPEAEYGIQNVNDILRHILGEGEPHSQQLSKYIVDAIEGEPVIRPHPKTGLPREVREGGLREEWGKKMDALENNLPDVHLPRSANMAAVEKELEKLIGPHSGLSDKEKDKFREVLAKTHPSSKAKTINGKEFFRAYRSLRSLEGEQRTKAFGLDPKSHDEWIARANETKQTYDDMEKIIKEYFPEDTMKRLYQLNHDYSTQIAPLHENPMYQQMLKHGRYSGDIVEALSGTTKGNGILNNMIRNNADLSRLVLGHSFAGNPDKLLKPNQLLDPFVNANPEIARLLGLQKEAQTQLQTAQNTAQMHKQTDMIPKLTKEIKEQQRMAKRLLDESEVTGLTKTEITTKKMAYEKAQKKLRATMYTLLGSTILGGAGIKITPYVMKNMIE